MSTHAPVDHYARHLGIVVENFDNGSATASLTVGPEHLNPHGTAHGALLFSVVGAALAVLGLVMLTGRGLGRLDG